MAESRELIDHRNMGDVDVPFDLEDGSSVERMIETVRSSVSSLPENSVDPNNSHPMSIIVGKQNTSLSNCTINVTNIHGSGDKTSFLAQRTSSGMSPLDDSLQDIDGLHKQFASDAQPSPRWIKPEREMLLRVVPVTAELQDWSDVMILTVWLCWDDDKTFHNLIKCEHENGNVTLDSYDTFILKRSDSSGFQKDDCINIHLETNEENTWQPTENENNIVAVQVWSANRAKCSFRLNSCRNRRDNSKLYVTLRVFQNTATGHSESKFILRKRTAELQLIQQQKDTLLDILDTSSSADSDNAGGFSPTCMAIPYVDSMLHLTDDIVVTLWLCWCDGKRQALETLKEEQKIYSRILLDTENSFVISDTEEVVVTDMLQNGHYRIISGPQTVQPRRVCYGMRAKFQFISRKVQTRSEYILKESRQRNHRVNNSEIRKKLISGEIREDEDDLFTKENLDVKLITKQENGMQIDFKKIKELTCFLLRKERDSMDGGLHPNNLSRRWGHFSLPERRYDLYIFMAVPLVCLCFIADVMQSQLSQELPDRRILLQNEASTDTFTTTTTIYTGGSGDSEIHYTLASPLPQLAIVIMDTPAPEVVKEKTWLDFAPDFVARLYTSHFPLVMVMTLFLFLILVFGNRNGLRYNSGSILSLQNLMKASQIIFNTSKTYLNGLRGYYRQDTRRGPAEVGDGASILVVEGHGRVQAAIDVPKQTFNICVLRIHLLMSYKEDSDNLVFKLLFSKVLWTNSEDDLIHNELSDWTLADSSDTLLLQIPPEKKGGASVIETSIEAHYSSSWKPVVCEKLINIEEIMEGEIVQQNYSLTKSYSESENGRVYVTVKVMQKHETIQREVQFIVRKTVKDIKKLMKERRNTVASSLPACPSKVVDWEYQTCLIVPYMDLMQDTNDDIILTVWICSIQQNTQEFYALQNEQKHFSRVQLDTENSFVLSNMDTPITAILTVLKGSFEVMEFIKEIEPLQIKDGQRAKFQFVCKGVDIFDMVDLKITILQKGESNKVQFMARKKVELFLERDCRLQFECLPGNFDE